MDENLVHIAEKMQVPEDTDDIDPEDTDDIDPENTDDIDSEDADDIDSEDLQGASLDDALDTIEGKNVPKHIAEWPNVANLNIYDACVPDRMYHIDLGLFKYQLEFTQDILKIVGGTELQKEFNERL
ncbi:hypothetical protein C1646_769524 [Rhizophagus diaphanus]|nr:hypothetical protein C1646_769524 [Rhizophagus diaphanus] [Rhizophagus sp. MUCL 43196]